MADILVCDDDAIFRYFLGRSLARRGLDVVCAESAEQAIARLARGPLTYAVIDLDLPATNGFQLLCELLGRAPNMRVLVLTRNYSPAVHHAALLLGAHGCLSKPADAAEIMNCFMAASPRRLRDTRAFAALAERQQEELDQSTQRDVLGP